MPFLPLTPEKQAAPCQSREHNPPSLLCFNGIRKWQCSACGHIQVILGSWTKPLEVPDMIFENVQMVDHKRAGTICSRSA